MPNTFYTTSAFSPVETYSTRADVERWYGRDNVRAWADLNSNNDDDEIAAQIQWARVEAQTLIHEALAGESLTTPATAETFTFYTSLTSVEAELAGVMLYQTRGISDRQQTAGDTDGVMQGHREAAMARLAGLISKHLKVDGTDDSPNTFQFVPVRRISDTDEYASD